MPDTLKKLRIFAASPSDVATERAKLETVVASLKPTADYLGLTLEVVDWRAVVPDAGRAQQIIFDQLKPTSWDIFVGILWHRFGTPPGGKDPQTQKEYLSGTEEEFRVAYRLWKEFKKPRIVMYRCTRAIPLDADFAQAQRVKDFFKEIQDPQGEFRVLTQSFDTPEVFEKLALDNLQKLLIEYGEQSKTPITPEVAQILAPQTPNNLPRRAAFFGRAKEMDVVMRALSPADRTWGVLVDGIGGIGKTALAIEAAYRAQDTSLFDAFVFITAKQNILKPTGIQAQTPAARTLNDFLNETARVLGQPGIPKLSSDEKRRALLDALRASRALLIYDNLETLSKEEQEAMADFLRELPQACKAIITSRRRGGEGAVWLRVEKLDWDAARGIIDNEMARDVGLANKLRRVPESRWQELYDETNGSPLALVHTLGLMRVRAALTFDGALAMLRGNHDPDLQKFIFQEAHKELTTNDKAALGALSFFVPSATFEAWMQVADLSRNALETTIDRLSALSLVDVLAGEERYALHPLTRAFVRDELLADANVARETGMRFAQYWVDYAEQYGGSSKESCKTYSQLETEWANLDAAIKWFAEVNTIARQDKAQLYIELVRAIDEFLRFSGRWDEALILNGTAYEEAYSMGNWRNAAFCAMTLFSISEARGSDVDKVYWQDRLADSLGHIAKRDTTFGPFILGMAAFQKKDYTEAARLLKESLSDSHNSISDLQLEVTFHQLGTIARDQKEYEIAERYYMQSLELSRKRGSRGHEVKVYSELGQLACDCKQWARAQEWFEKEVALAKELGNQEWVAEATYSLARVHEAEGHVDLALPLAQDALKIYERLRHRDLAEVRELVERLKANQPPP
ncbi:MAG: tetratricopeptide repeat protein [Chloroflexi bacterium]|nr:tetratricopeptide repeat protein [Chloroflexota bacterium]